MIKQDYKPQNNNALSKRSHTFKIPTWMTHPFLIGGMAVCVLALAWVLSVEPSESESMLVVEQVNQVVEENKLYSSPIEIDLSLENSQSFIQALPEDSASTPFIEDKWQTETIKKGDNLSLIFKRIGLTPQQVHQVISLDENTQLLKKLIPSKTIAYKLDDNNNLQALKYIINIQQTLYIDSQNGELTSRIDNKAIEYRTAYAYGTIDDSLFTAGKKAGLTDSQVMQLANIFGWDIDFILDIRKGDSFSMLYQEEYIEGEKIGNGDILAAEFVNQGKSFQAVRYIDSRDNNSYYTPDGMSMRKAFLRAPLKFAYISSNFKPRRFHPILKKWKAHRGIDYRAPTGTPIRAAGDGRVIASSYSKYNGKYVFIQHGQGIVTKYLHMSKRAVSNNKRVKQGQVIGYVGATGLAEAPHLHYEFLVNGVHRNPRTVKLPKAKPIAKDEKDRFLIHTRPWIEQLASRNQLVNNTQNIAP
ncbi:peptidoglycan DD-metalloendopeptidase family protein [Aliikangiella maris]|uniref:Peptidoglycan DD-metalloendopeptidase family protein n=2 Tax=Aliikangiella maris TaxID=3162458 RepID=A0ABV3MU12_9GAMM